MWASFRVFGIKSEDTLRPDTAEGGDAHVRSNELHAYGMSGWHPRMVRMQVARGERRLAVNQGLLCSVHVSSLSALVQSSCVAAEKKARLKATPTLLPQPKPAAQGSAAARLLTVNPLLVASLVLALAAVLFQVPHRFGLFPKI